MLEGTNIVYHECNETIAYHEYLTKVLLNVDCRQSISFRATQFIEGARLIKVSVLLRNKALITNIFT